MPMPSLTRCRCGGFVPLAAAACPHCGESRSSLVRWGIGLLALAGGTATAVTLAACYGPGCVGDECNYTPPDLTPPADMVGDMPTDGGTGG